MAALTSPELSGARTDTNPDVEQPFAGVLGGQYKDLVTTADTSARRKRLVVPIVPAASTIRGARTAGELVRGAAAETVNTTGSEALLAAVNEAASNAHKGAEDLLAATEVAKAAPAGVELSSVVDANAVDTAAARVMVEPVVVELISASSDRDPAVVADAAATLIEASETAGVAAEAGPPKAEKTSESERDLYKRLAFTIQKKIMSELDPEEVRQAFENGGAEAYFKMLKERFAANERLRVIGEWLEAVDKGDPAPVTADATPGPISTAPPSPTTARPRRKIGDPATPTATPRPRRTIIPPVAPTPPPDPDVDPGTPPAPDVDPDAVAAAEYEASVKMAEAIEKGEAMQRELEKAREDFARLVVESRTKGWARRSLHKDLAAAAEKYNTIAQRFGEEALKYFEDVGMDEAEIRAKMLTGFRIEMQLQEENRNDAILEKDGTRRGRARKKFYKWFTKQKGARGFFKKSLLVSAPLAALTAAPVMALGLGGVVAGGALFAGRAARGALSAKLEQGSRGEARTADDTQDADSLDRRSQEAVINITDVHELPGYFASILVDTSLHRVEQDQRANRKLMRRSIGATAIGAGVGAAVGVVAAEPNVIGRAAEKLRELRDSVGGVGEVAGSIKVDTAGFSDASVWEQMNQLHSTGNSTPLIQELAAKAEAGGWTVDAWERGINSLTAPDGQVFSGNAQVAAALEYIYKH